MSYTLHSLATETWNLHEWRTHVIVSRWECLYHHCLFLPLYLREKGQERKFSNLFICFTSKLRSKMGVPISSSDPLPRERERERGGGVVKMLLWSTSRLRALELWSYGPALYWVYLISSPPGQVPAMF